MSRYRCAFATLLVLSLVIPALGCARGRAAGPGMASGASTAAGGGGDVGWEKVGERRIGFGVDHDVIPVTRFKGDFRRIRIKVEESRVHMIDLKIVYATGGVQDVQLRKEFARGSWSRIIDLRGGDRVIRSIKVTYRTEGLPRNGRASLEVWAKN